jgi:hypothetical protein
MLQQRNIFQGLSIVIILLLCGSAAGWAMPQDVMNDKPSDTGKTEAGYAIVTPANGAAGLVVFETFGEHRMSEVTQAGVLPSDMTKHSLLYVNTDGRLSKNLGIAIANPGAADAKVTLTLKGADGKTIPGATKDIKVAARTQVAQFVTQLFTAQSAVPHDFTGTLDIVSDVPVAVVGLRFRGQNFSTLPVTNFSFPTEVPVNGPVGGPGAIILAQLAIGGGWATEIVIVNTAALEATVRLDLFTNAGKPMTATLNGQTNSSFPGIKIPAMGVVTLSQPED